LSARQKAPASQEQTTLEFKRNALLPALAGGHDRHCAFLENRLGVKLATRGNLVSIEGPAAARHVAARVLQALYARLEKEEEISTAEVDTQIRFAQDTPKDSSEAEHGAASIRTATAKRTRARSRAQVDYLDLMRSHELVFGVGPAGTGKTYLAAAYGAHLLFERKVERLILSRPALEAGERLGFLPGDLREKIDPYLRPLYDALFEVIGEQATKMMESGVIEVAPLAFMRGRTLSRAFIILDEAQNCSHAQMKMFLTRLGEDSRMVVAGDLSQSDLPEGPEGLSEALRYLKDVQGVALMRFTKADVVRHPLVSRIVDAYDAHEKDERAHSR
jgi:phosphate starvation-inducible PhoH-like protein